jgi:hypothetical protein
MPTNATRERDARRAKNSVRRIKNKIPSGTALTEPPRCVSAETARTCRPTSLRRHLSVGGNSVAAKWIPILGTVDISENGDISFRGGQQEVAGDTRNFNFALAMKGSSFGGGAVSADVTFLSPVTNESHAGIILYRHPNNDAFTVAQLGGHDLCSVWTFFSGATQATGSAWTRLGGSGQGTTLMANKTYSLRVDVAGSNVAMTLDDVSVTNITLPYSLPRGNPGLWFRGPTDVRISNFTVSRSLSDLVKNDALQWLEMPLDAFSTSSASVGALQLPNFWANTESPTDS